MNIVSMFCFIAKYTGEIIILFVVLRYVLYELVDVDHAVSDVHGSRVVYCRYNQPLVESEMIDGAEGESEISDLLGSQVSCSKTVY